MRSPSKTICFCRIWGDFIIVIHGVTFESQSPQTRMITDFFLVLSVLNEQHFFNDQYRYQTSKKIRQVFDYKRRNGQYIGSFAPYGYLKDPKDKHQLIVDPDAAEIVKLIYDLCLQGMARRAMVYYLNDPRHPKPHNIPQGKGPACQFNIGQSPVGRQNCNPHSYQSDLYRGFGTGPPPGEKLQSTPD